MRLLGFADVKRIRAATRQLVRDALQGGRRQREPQWTEAAAVGQREFVVTMQRDLYLRCPERRIDEQGGDFRLGESLASCRSVFGPEKRLLSVNTSRNQGRD
jgi:hypothetical protein